MSKDNEIKISLNLDKLVEEAKEQEEFEMAKKVFSEEEIKSPKEIEPERTKKSKEKIKVKEVRKANVYKKYQKKNEEENNEVKKIAREQKQIIKKEPRRKIEQEIKKEKKDDKKHILKNEVKKENIRRKDKIVINDQNEYNIEDNNNLDDIVELVNKHNEKIEIERKPRIGRTYNEAKEEKTEKKEEVKNKKNIGKFLTFLIFLVVVVSIYLLINYASIIGIKLPTNLIKEVSVNIVSTDTDLYKEYGNEILVYSNHKVTTYDKKGKNTWEYTLETAFNPNLYVYKKYMIISNNPNGTIYLFKNKKEILNMKVDGSIESIYMDDDGNMAIEYSTSSYKKIVGVYNSSGKNLYNSYLDFTSVIDIKLLENATKLLIVQADSNSFKISSSVSVLDSTINDREIKQLLKLDNNYIYSICESENKIVILTDTGIICYDVNTNDKKELKKFDSSQMLFIALLENHYAFIEKTLEDNSKYKLNTFDFNNVEISDIELSNSPKTLVSSKYLNYLLYQNKLQVVNKWGIEVLSKELNKVPKDIIIFNNNKSAALIYTNQIDIVNL